jgi:hypothetical protein
MLLLSPSLDMVVDRGSIVVLRQAPVGALRIESRIFTVSMDAAYPSGV